MAAGDFNNDGAPDIAVANGSDGTITIFMNSDSVTVVNANLQVYNGVSINRDGVNDVWFIPNINKLENTKLNHVAIYDRWGDSIYEGDNYDNTSVVFDGHNKSGNPIASGIYFYKISFASGINTLTGYLSIKN